MSKFISNSFQVPNALIDELLDKLSGNACKIYLLIIRKTRGWHKEADRISYSQIQKLTGIGSYATIDKAISELVNFGLICVKSGNEKRANEYRLNDSFAFTETVKGGITETVKAFTETVKGGITETVNTEIHSFKNTKTKDSVSVSDDTHAPPPTPKKSKSPKSDLKLNPNGIEKPDELDNQIWLDFLKVKKQRTKDDLSVTAWNRFINPVLLAQQKTNHSLDEIFGFWIGETKWVGFNCDWYLNRLETNNKSDFANQPRTFDEQGNIYAAHQPNYQSNHQPHPNSTTAYVQRLNKDLAELKRDLYGE